MAVHEAARRGFGRAAEAYDRGRPDYPAEAIAWLVCELGLRPGRTVLDVGAGTGKLTRALIPAGAEVVAVEPVAAMRSVLEQTVGGVRALEATAEALPLGEGSVDAVVSGQAFHWFDAPAALGEFHRVLGPGGRLALIWNRRRLEQPLQRAIGELIEPYRGDVPAHRGGKWRAALRETTLFSPAGELHVPFEQQLDAVALLDRVGSTSFVAALPDRERAEVLDGVRALADASPAPLLLAYTCEASVYERRS